MRTREIENHYRRAAALLSYVQEKDEDGAPVVKELEHAQAVILASIAESLAGLLHERAFGYHT